MVRLLLLLAVLVLAPDAVSGIDSPPRLRRSAETVGTDNGSGKTEPEPEALALDEVNVRALQVDGGLIEKSNCVPQAGLTGWAGNDLSNHECLRGCTFGCCRIHNQLQCDTRNDLRILECVCNSNTRTAGMFDQGWTITAGGVSQAYIPTQNDLVMTDYLVGGPGPVPAPVVIPAPEGQEQGQTQSQGQVSSSFGAPGFAGSIGMPTPPTFTPYVSPSGAVSNFHIRPGSPREPTTPRPTSAPAPVPQAQAVVLPAVDSGSTADTPAPGSTEDNSGTIPATGSTTDTGSIPAALSTPAIESNEETGTSTATSQSNSGTYPVPPATTTPPTTTPTSTPATTTPATTTPATTTPASAATAPVSSASEGTATTPATTPQPGSVAPDACANGAAMYWDSPAYESFVTCTTTSDDCNQAAGECCLVNFCLCGKPNGHITDKCVPSYDLDLLRRHNS